MTTSNTLLSAAVAALTTFSTVLTAGELSGNLSLEGRLFFNDPAYPGQTENGGFSIGFQPEYKHKWGDDKQQFTFSPFLRLDSVDNERTHGDIRRLDYFKSQGDWEFQIGIDKKFWGVTESQHLVDIINQTDGIEGLDGEEKLGQPMIRATRLTETGSVDLFVLPYFRERTFAGKSGRFRLPLIIDVDAATFESSRKEKHVDYALRWSGSNDKIDWGLSYFDGTSRDPDLLPGLKNGADVLVPHYAQIRQLGVNLQYTGEATIWKFEGIHRRRDDDGSHYNAAVGGFEHTLPGFESGAELGLLAEYHYDSRGDVASAPFQNDLFVGGRLALNDENSSELLAGAIVDLGDGSTSLRLEGSRRLGNSLKLNVEAQILTGVKEDNPVNAFAVDDYIQLELQKFF